MMMMNKSKIRAVVQEKRAASEAAQEVGWYDAECNEQ